MKYKTPYYCLKCKNKGARHAAYKGGNLTLKCNLCGKTKSYRRNTENKKRQADSKYLCKECSLASRPTGLENPAWRGGISFVPYPVEWSEQLREAIRTRDNHECQLCAKQQVEMTFKLDVHHIDYDKSNLDPRNLISLCRPCHTKTNFNREQWPLMFSENRVEA